MISRRASIAGVYAVTPDLSDTELLLAKTRAVIAGGVPVLQYRNKTADPDLRREQALALRELCMTTRTRLIINDHVELAHEVDADGVHIGMDDPSFATARARLGTGKIIGVSCYNDFQRARTAAALGANYVAFGSFFTSSVKPGAVRAPLTLLEQARTELGLEPVAIGGITLSNAPSVIAAGAAAIAVISALFFAADVEAEAREFCRLFQANA